jgi:TetR/AcrR family fatty acid metabolism transcriptional regulator
MTEPLHVPPAADDKRQRICESARQVIIERGFDAAKMDEIAARAGVGKGTLYLYFSSKEDLFLGLVMDHFERITALVDAEVERVTDPWEQIEAGWRTLMLRVFPELVEEWNLNYQLWGLLARDPNARERLFTQWRDLYRERERRTMESIREGQASGHFRADTDPALLSPLLLAIFDGLLHRALFDPERVDPETVLRGLLDLIRKALAPLAAGQAR